MSENLFKHYYDRWQPAKPLPTDDNGIRKRRAFLRALAQTHAEQSFMSERQLVRWLRGSSMMTMTAKACADVLIGTDPNRAGEYRQFIENYGSKPWEESRRRGAGGTSVKAQAKRTGSSASTPEPH